MPIRNSNAIVNYLEILSQDKNLLDELSHKSSETMQDNTWSNYVDQLDKLILELIKNKP